MTTSKHFVVRRIVRKAIMQQIDKGEYGSSAAWEAAESVLGNIVCEDPKTGMGFIDEVDEYVDALHELIRRGDIVILNSGKFSEKWIRAHWPRQSKFSIVQRRDYYVVDNSDGQVAESDFETRAEARQWIKEYTTRTGRFAPLMRNTR